MHTVCRGRKPKNRITMRFFGLGGPGGTTFEPRSKVVGPREAPQAPNGTARIAIFVGRSESERAPLRRNGRPSTGRPAPTGGSETSARRGDGRRLAQTLRAHERLRLSRRGSALAARGSAPRAESEDHARHDPQQPPEDRRNEDEPDERLARRPKYPTHFDCACLAATRAIRITRSATRAPAQV